MRIQFLAAAAAVSAVSGGCEPAPQPQPNEMEQVVNATRVDPGVAPGALGNESVNYGEGNITPSEREAIRQVEDQSPGEVVAQFANLLVQRRFDEAYRMWDPQAADFTSEQFASVFESFETINPAIGLAGTAGGAAGSAQVQLTLSGMTKDGENYSVTGPVTLSRSGDGEQARWQVAKVVLTANPRAAEALVEQ